MVQSKKYDLWSGGYPGVFTAAHSASELTELHKNFDT